MDIVDLGSLDSSKPDSIPALYQISMLTTTGDGEITDEQASDMLAEALNFIIACSFHLYRFENPSDSLPKTYHQITQWSGHPEHYRLLVEFVDMYSKIEDKSDIDNLIEECSEMVISSETRSIAYIAALRVLSSEEDFIRLQRILAIWKEDIESMTVGAMAFFPNFISDIEKTDSGTAAFVSSYLSTVVQESED